MNRRLKAECWWLMTDEWWILDNGRWIMDGWYEVDDKKNYGDLMAWYRGWARLEIKQSQVPSPRDCGERGMGGSLWTSSPKWIGLGLDGVREGWRKGAMTEIGGGEGWGVGISSLHFLLVWPDGTIVDGHADNWDWKLVARINYRLFLPHIQLWGLLWKKKSEIFSFLFGLSQGTSRPPPVTLGETTKKQLAEMRRGFRGVCDLAHE